ncbi:MAG: hypothetical protein COC23_02235 [Hyphomicrobiales bacterium]|nr:MAG: hypothetical protein COC23_02235 [Hyphomicrobiales bacterium]
MLKILFSLIALAAAWPDFALAQNAGKELIVEARASAKGATIESGMIWRVFGGKPGEDKKLPLIASKRGGTSSFSLPAGTYLIHAAYGRASATKRISISKADILESFVMEAGGLHLNATAAGAVITNSALIFMVYGIDQDDQGNRELIAGPVGADTIIRLSAGTYHVVSKFGDINASVRAELQVKAGKVTQATLQQRAAIISLKFVSRKGGDPIANTAWTVLSEPGEKLFESNSVSPTLILSEGKYEASVRNGDKVYAHNFEVVTGKKQVVEVLLK